MSDTSTQDSNWEEYYVAESAAVVHWGTIGLFVMLGSCALLLNGHGFAEYTAYVGFALTIYTLFNWFRDQIKESHAGILSAQVDRTYRWGMGWFIFSEIMFFSAFFGALWYARVLVLPWLSGDVPHGLDTHEYLFPNFELAWPSTGPEDWGGAFKLVAWSGLPLVNTLLLLTSGVTLEIAHHGLMHNNRKQLVIFMCITVALGVIFLGCQALEYVHAYSDNLTLESGIYGSTFYMLTGFHGMHVLLGTIMLLVMTIRCMKGHFTPENHFAFESAAWYWHFVDVVWIGLFFFVYIL